MLSMVNRTDVSSDERIAWWERQTRWVITLAAVAPFLSRLLPRGNDGLNLAVDLVTWLIFMVDFVVHLRIQSSYWRSGRGVFDTAILVLTFPWYVIPGVGSTAFTIVFRWARLARLVFTGETGRRFLASMRRLGTLGIALALSSLLAALIVFRHEPEAAGFDSLGDALWWSMVSFTTVGYGDLYPTTTAGRVAGGLMMFMGLMALGTVSGVLASTFNVDKVADPADDASGPVAFGRWP
jgi:voltage-gated potassium channel